MTLNELAHIVHLNAIEKGWWENDRDFGEVIALTHQELSEAYQEWRNGHKYTELYYSEDAYGRLKPEGIPVELIDVILRVLDFLGSLDIDIDDILQQKMEYNKNRPYRHGGLKA